MPLPNDPDSNNRLSLEKIRVVHKLMLDRLNKEKANGR
jgi:hypothetical protein